MLAGMSRPTLRARPLVILLTGLPSSGKTTLGGALRDRLQGKTRCQLLDGDELRARLPPALGFAPEDRRHQGQRALYLAELLLRHDVTVIVALIAPLAETRDSFRETFGDQYVEVFLDAPREVRAQRDTRGVYALARARGDDAYESVEGIYERPATPDLTIDTAGRSPQDALDALLSVVRLQSGLAVRTVGGAVFLPARPLEE